MIDLSADSVLGQLIDYRFPGHEVIHADAHSDSCVSLSLVSPDYKTVICRFNLAESGRWSMIPILNCGVWP